MKKPFVTKLKTKTTGAHVLMKPAAQVLYYRWRYRSFIIGLTGVKELQFKSLGSTNSQHCYAVIEGLRQQCSSCKMEYHIEKAKTSKRRIIRRYNDLIVERNARPTRAGRGIAAGRGKPLVVVLRVKKPRTGHKKMPATFMGGQCSYAGRTKVKGFKSLHKKAELVYTDNLNGLTRLLTISSWLKLTSHPIHHVKIIIP